MILAIDTAGPVAGVAAWDGERLAERVGRVPRGTEVALAGWISDLLAEQGRPPSAIRGVAVAAGPGAFTGLRVGLATAAGLALALGVPVWAGGSLHSRAARAGLGGDLVALLDARKGRVYAARWRGTELVGEVADLSPEAALEGLVPGFRATGEGALAYRTLIEERGGIVSADAEDPGVSSLVRQGAEALRRGEGIDPTLLAPRYVRAPDAVPRAERRGPNG